MLKQHPKVKKDVLNRTASIIGHMQAVKKMIEDDSYCIDIIHQTQAVQAAINKLNEMVLEDHLKTCVSKSMKKGQGAKHVKEIMNTVRFGNKAL